MDGSRLKQKTDITASPCHRVCQVRVALQQPEPWTSRSVRSGQPRLHPMLGLVGQLPDSIELCRRSTEAKPMFTSACRALDRHLADGRRDALGCPMGVEVVGRFVHNDHELDHRHYSEKITPPRDGWSGPEPPRAACDHRRRDRGLH